jgi:hypothetical protein
VIRYGGIVAWADPSASGALISFLAQSARNLSPSPRGGRQIADHIAGVLATRDPEPHVAFAVIGPSDHGWASLLHGPVQAWDGARWLAPTPTPGWLQAIITPRPAITVGAAGTPTPAPEPDAMWDLEAGVVPGAGFVLVPSGVPGRFAVVRPPAEEQAQLERDVVVPGLAVGSALKSPGNPDLPGEPVAAATTALPAAEATLALSSLEPLEDAGADGETRPAAGETDGAPSDGADSGGPPARAEQPESEATAAIATPAPPPSAGAEEPGPGPAVERPGAAALGATAALAAAAAAAHRARSDEAEPEPAASETLEPEPTAGEEPEPDPTAAIATAGPEAAAAAAIPEPKPTIAATTPEPEPPVERPGAAALGATAALAAAAANRSQSEEPEAAPPPPRKPSVPGPAGSLDLRSVPLAAGTPLPRGGGPDLRVPGAPVVAGALCARGHLNRPGLTVCARCRTPIPDGTKEQVTGTRPPLGVLVRDDGLVYRLDQGYLVGSAPGRDPTVGGGLARPLILSGSDVSGSHAELRLADWDVVLVDRGSAAGTCVFEPGAAEWIRLNPYEPHVLPAGTHMAFGQRVMTFISPWMTGG